ncbi:MAG: peptidase T [Elusimicrobiaceae bacterium]|nr:peptidase T [Elusimicrobiaceae bacterium]
MENFKEELLNSLTKYVQIESGSEFDKDTCPSTPGQLELAKTLEKDLRNIGITDVSIDNNGYLFATIPANTDKKVPVIGFLAHMDTYPGFTIGRKVIPQLHKNYQGGDIVVSKKHNVIISPKNCPTLKSVIGHDIITSSGDTLLGTDDKGGIVIIMAMAKYLMEHPEVKHGKIRIAFTPDEEIGKGSDHFDVKAFGADFAYTLDGQCGEGIVYENFNAAGINIDITGVLAHTGYAKGVMQNPVRIASDIVAAWPEKMLPETTEGYEGFVCFNDLKADFEKATLKAAVRDFTKKGLEEKINLVKDIVAKVQKKYPTAILKVSVKEQYENMAEIIKKNPKVVDLARKAFEKNGLAPSGQPIRGGTDGARLSFMGLATPNIDAGYSTPHGPFEWASLDLMNKIVHALITIVQDNLN